MKVYQAVISGNVDIKEGVIFVKSGLFYSEEVKNKYPYMFEEPTCEEIVEPVEAEEIIEPVLVIEPVIEEVEEVEEIVVPELVEEEIVEVKEVIETKVTNTKK
jgi:hypothetical protein